MEVTFEKIGNIPLQATNVNGEMFYNLADVMEQKNAKPTLCNRMNNPLHISGRIVWGWRMVDGNFLESVFVDRSCAEHLLRNET